MTLKIGDTVEGRYKVLSEIDSGGMGTVFLAEHHLIKRRVALKLLRPDLAEDVDTLERFMNEARIAGTLGHPNIVESTDMGFTRDGVPYIVFELLEGSLLTDEIYRTRGFPVRRALRIARQIASALAASHAAGIIHRDLKSDNVFLTDREDAMDHVKVLDFGVSQFIGGEARNVVVGTPQFMAPEQITSPGSVDGRADVYALGVILYEMLAARRPFADHDDPNVVFQRILNEEPAPLEVSNLPPGLEVLLFERFITKRADERFATMRDVEGALAAFAGIVRPEGSRDSVPILALSAAAGLPATTESSPSLPAPVQAITLPRAPAQRPSVAWIIAAVVAAAGGVGLVATSKSGSQASGVAQATAADASVARDDASKLASAIEASTRGAQLRADGLAQTPMFRAAIETDAKTVADMLRSEYKLKLESGEVFQMSQLRDGKRVVLTRLPPTAGTLPTTDKPALHVADGALSVVVTSPVLNPDGKLAGAVELLVPVELGSLRDQIAAHASELSLTGLDAPLAIHLGSASEGAGSAAHVEAPIAFEKTLAVGSATLSETIAPPAAAASASDAAGGMPVGALAAWGGAGFLALIYVGSLLRARRRD
jgi:serine/threonine-protein kinase|nr:serine/threonine-protein kinase [Kofleriaceae bacterium]